MSRKPSTYLQETHHISRNPSHLQETDQISPGKTSDNSTKPMKYVRESYEISQGYITYISIIHIKYLKETYQTSQRNP